MNPKVIMVLIGCVIFMAIALFIRTSWDKWRKNTVIEAGKPLGFHHLTQAEKLQIAVVPLNEKGAKYFLILTGNINGYEAAYFDLIISAGKAWFYQSTVMVVNSGVTIPMFQLKSRDWSHVISQRTCGDPLQVPGREKDMESLKLSSKNPQWALQTFSKATPQFFEKLRKGKWTIEGVNHSLFIYSWGRTIYPKKMRDYVREAGEIATEMYSLCS